MSWHTWSPRTRLLVGTSAILVVLAALGIDAALRARDADSDLRVARTDIRDAAEALRGLIALDTDAWPTPEEFARARGGLESGESHLQSASDRLGYLKGLARGLGWLPRWGHAVSRGPEALALGQDTVAAARTLVDLSEPVFEAGDAADAAVLVAEVRTMLVERNTELDDALVRLEEIGTESAILADGEWPWPFASGGALLALLSDELTAVPRARETVREVALGFDALLGFDGARTYVVMGQNDHEIRATGGFLGTLGSMTIAGGQATDSRFGQVQDYEKKDEPYPAPPAEFSLYYGGAWWRLRDYNWEPDFPRSAEAVMQSAEEHGGLVGDGAMAIDTYAIAQLVEVFEPLDVPAFEVPVTSDNWRRLVETGLLENLEIDPAARADGKETFMEPIMEALISRIESISRDEFAPFLAALRRSVEGRHLQIYSRIPEAQRLVEYLGASGRLIPEAAEDADYLSVVDTNLSESKVQPAISREITYLYRIDGWADVVVRWRNDPSTLDLADYPRFSRSGVIFDPGSLRWEPTTGVFGNFVRFYLPADSELGATAGMDRGPRLTLDESGLVVLGGFTVIPQGESRTVSFSYRTGAERGVPLFIRKQGGQQRDTIRVLQNLTEGEQVTLYEGAFDRDLLLMPQSSALSDASEPAAGPR